MKTGGMEVRCDGCSTVIPVMHPTALFVTLRGPVVRHQKRDFCQASCLATWALHEAGRASGAAAPPDPETVRQSLQDAAAILELAAGVCAHKFDSTVCVAPAGHDGPHITSNAQFPHGLQLPVSGGAPTPAMIAAACEALYGPDWYRLNVLKKVEAVLRAALTAPEKP